MTSQTLVLGWIIDYRAAKQVFVSANNARISRIIEMRSKDSIFICHHEENRFKGDAHLETAFMNGKSCTIEPDQDIYNRAALLAQSLNGKPLLVGGEAAIYITAAALSKNFGVISDHQSPKYLTVHDLCPLYGVPIFTSDEYFK